MISFGCCTSSYPPSSPSRCVQVGRLAEMLGFTKVGWVFAHPPREDDFIMTAFEVHMAGLQQLEHANGVGPTPFVSLRVKPDEDGNAAVDAFQVRVGDERTKEKCFGLVCFALILNLSAFLLSSNPSGHLAVHGDGGRGRAGGRPQEQSGERDC